MMCSQKDLHLSLPRRRESRDFSISWIPVLTEMTETRDFRVL
jgi:hypothetical protein